MNRSQHDQRVQPSYNQNPDEMLKEAPVPYTIEYSSAQLNTMIERCKPGDNLDSLG